MTGRGSIRHNNRSFSAANVDRSRSEQNITFCNDDLKQVYHELFDEALAGDYYVDTCKEIDQKLLNAALCKKYFLYMEILENYPQLMQENPMFHRKLMEYVQENVCKILLDRHVPLSIKKRAWKYFANR